MKTEKRYRAPAFLIISFLLLIFFTTENADAFRNNTRGGRGQHDYKSAPRHNPRYRPEHRPHYRPKYRPAGNHRPRYRPHYRPKSHYKPYSRSHRRHYRNYPKFHIGLGNLFFPWPLFHMVPDVYVRPSVGSVTVSLPLGCSRITVGETVYFQNEGIYYKELPSGYVVTEEPQDIIQKAPPVTPPKMEKGEYASVTTRVLNVRSGPGFHYPVLRQVRMGDSLDIRGKQSGWLYVQTAGGELGWVVTRFTTKWEG